MQTQQNQSNNNKKSKTKWPVLLAVLLVVLATLAVVLRQRSTPYQRHQGMAFGTAFHITYQHGDDIAPLIDAELAKIDQSLSIFNDSSTISAVNNNRSLQSDDMLTEVFTLAQKVAEETGGAFDITVAPLVNAWGFGHAKRGQEPSAATIDSLRQVIGYKKISLKNSVFSKQDARVMLDCGAIAKGYACDIVARLMEEQKIKNYMIEIGGEVVTSGINPERMPWRIGVTVPTDDSLSQNQQLQAVLNVTDKAMATSGNYRNFYYKNGRKFAHTIDPATGRPVQHNILSATVLADNCATADAYATSFMVMGLDKAKVILKKHPELMAYIIYSDEKGKNAVWYSPSVEEKIVKE